MALGIQFRRTDDDDTWVFYNKNESLEWELRDKSSGQDAQTQSDCNVSSPAECQEGGNTTREDEKESSHGGNQGEPFTSDDASTIKLPRLFEQSKNRPSSVRVITPNWRIQLPRSVSPIWIPHEVLGGTPLAMRLMALEGSLTKKEGQAEETVDDELD